MKGDDQMSSLDFVLILGEVGEHIITLLVGDILPLPLAVIRAS